MNKYQLIDHLLIISTIKGRQIKRIDKTERESEEITHKDVK